MSSGALNHTDAELIEHLRELADGHIGPKQEDVRGR